MEIFKIPAGTQVHTIHIRTREGSIYKGKGHIIVKYKYVIME